MLSDIKSNIENQWNDREQSWNTKADTTFSLLPGWAQFPNIYAWNWVRPFLGSTLKMNFRAITSVLICSWFVLSYSLNFPHLIRMDLWTLHTPSIFFGVHRKHWLCFLDDFQANCQKLYGSINYFIVLSCSIILLFFKNMTFLPCLEIRNQTSHVGFW